MAVGASHLGYDLLAPVYGRLKRLVFGNRLREATGAFIDMIEDGQTLLIVGGGDGEILEDIGALGKNLDIVYVDASKKMVEKARKIVHSNNTIEYVVVRYENYYPKSTFDVIITPFFLDLFEGEYLRNIISKTTGLLRPQGIWLVSDFQRTGKLRHWFLEKFMYLFFIATTRTRASSLSDYNHLVQSAGLTIVSEKRLLDGFVCSMTFEKVAPQ